MTGSIASTVAPNDPFWLPGKIVEIDARSAHDGFLVEVRAAGPIDGHQVLDRAKAFAKTPSHGGWLFALSVSPRPWLLFDFGGDGGYFPSSRAYTSFVGMTIVPVKLWP
jgi:hypothetical protein